MTKSPRLSRWRWALLAHVIESLHGPALSEMIEKMYIQMTQVAYEKIDKKCASLSLAEADIEYSQMRTVIT
jgi:hypothetical protein